MSDFIQKYILKSKATSNIKIQKVYSFSGLSDVGIYLRDGSISSGIRIVSIHPSKGTHWVFYVNESYFDSYGCFLARKLPMLNKKRNGQCLYSEYKIQGLTSKRDSYCASYCYYIIYLTRVIGIDFISAVLNLYYQRFSQ